MVQNPGGIKGDAADYYDTSSAVIAQNDSSNPDGMAQFVLPCYGVESRSGRNGLTTVGVAGEIYTNYRRGRLMLFEIARRKRPWISVLLKNKDRVKLDEPASKLDRAIWDLQHDASSRWQVSIPMEGWDFPTQASSESNEELLEMGRMMGELMLNDSEIKAFLDSATATLLGLDKRLRDEFIQPLKQCMVNRQEVNYQYLLEKVREIHKEVAGCYFRLDEQVSRRQKELTDMAKID
ncbi:uncharacterized protein EAE97_003517 [Botrytis byssoidea]|uniref:Uncharacterized protein n=1 Tax=Botrytis byssoidea TaxID=139641 RepID=A0A9P5M134_9HELO|nr:uncharacterized protein EAE97_003517 [Botrytis byssoidea]KAF7948106.1 hypothetical protein EAE97_003517 [Botrytis byssoidea]